jgi:hypothetical protein
MIWTRMAHDSLYSLLEEERVSVLVHAQHAISVCLAWCGTLSRVIVQGPGQSFEQGSRTAR